MDDHCGVIDHQSIIDKYYGSESPLREILICHSRQVADLALEIARAKALPLDPQQVEAAAMLHDIGIFLTYAPGIECYGSEPYILHGLLGGQLLRREGAPEWAARVAERHTGSGLTIANLEAALERDYARHPQLQSPCGCAARSLPADPALMPQTLLEQLICYADKFYSKSGDRQRKPLDSVRRSMAKFGADSLQRFEDLHAMFGL